LRGFTAFAETAEPEEVMAVLRNYHARLGSLIHKYEGTLERFLGDGLMVLFNDPLRCPVRMAIEMRDGVAELAVGWRKHGHDLGSAWALRMATRRSVGSASKAGSITRRLARS
jgi:adenylate cyclase